MHFSHDFLTDTTSIHFCIMYLNKGLHLQPDYEGRRHHQKGQNQHSKVRKLLNDGKFDRIDQKQGGKRQN